MTVGNIEVFSLRLSVKQSFSIFGGSVVGGSTPESPVELGKRRIPSSPRSTNIYRRCCWTKHGGSPDDPAVRRSPAARIRQAICSGIGSSDGRRACLSLWTKAWTPGDVIRDIRTEACDAVVIKLTKMGGPAVERDTVTLKPLPGIGW